MDKALARTLLHLPENFTKEEVDKNFRNLVKFYHPDSAQNYIHRDEHESHLLEALCNKSDKGDGGDKAGTLLLFTRLVEARSVLLGILRDGPNTSGEAENETAPQEPDEDKPSWSEKTWPRIYVTVPPLLMWKGTHIDVISSSWPCWECDGRGINQQEKIQKCQECGGSGRIEYTHGILRVKFLMCNKCRGSGIQIQESCSACHGQGSFPAARLVFTVQPDSVRGEVIPGKIFPLNSGDSENALFVLDETEPGAAEYLVRRKPGVE